MAIDSSIALGVKPIQLENPMNRMAAMYQLQGAQQTNQLNQMKMQEAQQAVIEANALRQLDPSAPDYIDRVMKINPATGFAFAKSAQEAKNAKLTGNKTALDVHKEAKASLDQAWRDISRRPDDENIISYLRDVASSDLYPPEVKRIVASTGGILLKMPFADRGAFMASQGASSAELKPTMTSQQLGGTTQMLSTPAFGGPSTVVPGSVQTITESANNVATNARMKEEGRLNRGQAQAHFDETQALKREGLSELPPKEIQKREAKYPAATAALKESIAANEQLIKDLTALQEHPGLKGITGTIYGRTPSVVEASREAKAKFDKIMARGGFQELAKMRAASPTGGALGNVSDTEGKYLRAAFAAMDPNQSTESFKKAVNDAVEELKGSNGRIQEAYNMTYDYKAPRTASPALGTPKPAPVLKPGATLKFDAQGNPIP